MIPSSYAEELGETISFHNKETAQQKSDYFNGASTCYEVTLATCNIYQKHSNHHC